MYKMGAKKTKPVHNKCERDEKCAKWVRKRRNSFTISERETKNDRMGAKELKSIQNECEKNEKCIKFNIKYKNYRKIFTV